MSTTPTPTVGSLATARERLETANFRLGKAQVAAIMSSAVARQDAADLAERTTERDAADLAYRALVAKLTTLPGQLQEANAEEVRQRVDLDEPTGIATMATAPPTYPPARLFSRLEPGGELHRPALGVPVVADSAPVTHHALEALPGTIANGTWTGEPERDNGPINGQDD